MKQKEYDVVVIGSGCGMNIVEEALSFGLEVALIDKGPLGGTCPNTGCIPSKMLIFPADRIVEVQEARKLGIQSTIQGVDFSALMERTRKWTRENQEEMRHGISHAEHLDFFEAEGHFIDDHTLEVGGKKVHGGKIFIASGARPSAPPIKGLAEAGFLTNESLLQLKEKPASLAIIGGGAIAVEYGHFFAAVGVKVTMIEYADRLVLSEEKEVSERLKQELNERIDVFTDAQIDEVRVESGRKIIAFTDRKSGQKKRTAADAVLVATGRVSNADLLQAQKAGLELDKRGFIKTNEFLETNQKHIYAVGDANGVQMFTHVANRESVVAVHNALHGSRLTMDYDAAPHAIYTWPQIASVGMTEEQARVSHKVLVGRAKYTDVAYGEILMEQAGFVKVIVDAKTKQKILGCHIIGPHASIVIQEVINAMASGGDLDALRTGMHIHPALPELVQRAFGELEEG